VLQRESDRAELAACPPPQHHIKPQPNSKHSVKPGKEVDRMPINSAGKPFAKQTHIKPRKPHEP